MVWSLYPLDSNHPFHHNMSRAHEPISNYVRAIGAYFQGQTWLANVLGSVFIYWDTCTLRIYYPIYKLIRLWDTIPSHHLILYHPTISRYLELWRSFCELAKGVSFLNPPHTQVFFHDHSPTWRIIPWLASGKEPWLISPQDLWIFPFHMA